MVKIWSGISVLRWEWEWGWSHRNGRELVWKTYSHTFVLYESLRARNLFLEPKNFLLTCLNRDSLTSLITCSAELISQCCFWTLLIIECSCVHSTRLKLILKDNGDWHQQICVLHSPLIRPVLSPLCCTLPDFQLRLNTAVTTLALWVVFH